MPWLATSQPDLPSEDVVSFALDHCDYDRDKPIYHSLENPSRTISHRQANDLVRKLVAGFRAAGLKKGDCFSITSFNDIMFSMLFLAGVGAGGIFSGMNPAYRAAEVRHHVHTAQVKFFICEPEFLPSLLEVLDKDGIGRTNLFVFNTQLGQFVPEGLRSWEWLLEQGSSEWDRITDTEVLKNTELSRLTTSGTTGPPKFAMQTHFNGTSYHTLTSAARDFPWDPKVLSVLPSFHVATVPAVHVSPLHNGTQIWIMRRFELEGYLAGIQQYNITDLGMAPPLVIAIINSPGLTDNYSLRSVRRIGCGAAPLDAESQGRLQALCARDCVFTQVWGMTETTSALSLFPWPEGDDTGSVGSCMLDGTDIKLIDETGKDVTDFDVRGEICVRGPTIVKGYLNNPKADAESWDEEGYFKTGDILYCDGKTKKWYIVDRKKELIKVRGFQVAPPEIEGVLLSHREIADCAVIGIPGRGPEKDEKVRAYVVKQPGSKLREDDVKKLVSDTLASYKRLTGGVVFVSEIPKSPSGKILKRLFREEVQKEMQPQAKL